MSQNHTACDTYIIWGVYVTIIVILGIKQTDTACDTLRSH